MRRLYVPPGRTGRLCGLVLGLCLAAGALVPARAHAGFTTCQSDPVVVLSNGATVDLQAGIQDSELDVKHVSYTLHVPTGTHAITVLNTDGLIGLTETVQVYSDDAANSYDSVTVVSTGQASVQVTASTTAVSVLGLVLGSKDASGRSGQSLSVHVSSLL